MAPKRWERIKQVLEECLERPPEERTAYLDGACGEDREMRREVESLVSSYESAGDLLEEPALGRGEEPEPCEGRQVGPYRILREIGEGGMARVYLAVRADDAAERQVAIKLVKRGMDFEFILRRFRHERQILASLDHPNIACLVDGGTTEDGVPYFVMEHIQGRPIDEHCDAHRLTIPARLQLFRTVCAAVEHAHQRGIVHRDIKPGNILITAEGTPKLLDFGIAKVLNPESWTGSFDPTATIMRLMTPEYASPEQVRGEMVTAATDVYSLGVLLYELLTGHRPYRLPSRAPHELARAICEAEPERPSTAVRRIEVITRAPFGTRDAVTPERVSDTRGTHPDRLRRVLAGDLDNIVLMAMRKEPPRRYGSAGELAEDLQRYLERRPVKARKDTAAYRAGKLIQRHRRGAVAAALAIPVLVLAAGAFFRMGSGGPGPGAGAAPNVTPFTTFHGNERQPSFSPDGRSILFTWGGERDENFDIYVKPLEGGELRRITTDVAEDESPVWSPDGGRVAFLRIKNDRVKRETGVFLAPAAGGGVHAKLLDVYPHREETVGRHIDWAPDGRYLAVTDKGGPEEPFRIYLADARTGAKRAVTEAPARSIGDMSPAFSPDGKRLAFLRSPSSGVTELCVAPAGGGEVRQLTSDSRVILSQTWTPDGKSLIFSSNRTGGFYLWQIAAGGGTPRRLPAIGDGATDPAFTRDGRRMAYSQFFKDTNIWRAETAGGRPPRPVISSTQYDSSPQYSPDGKRVAFRSSRSGYHEIWISDANGRRPVQLTHFDGPLTGTPRWSPDGKWIAFDTRPEGQADIYVAPSEGGQARRMTTETSEDVVPSWSRDGRWVYFASNRGGAWQTWKLPFAGGAKVQVTRNGGFAALEAADGWLYYAKGRGAAGLWRVPLAGGTEEPVLERLKPGFWGYWALGPEGIYFADTPEDQPGGIYFLRLRDRRVRRLFTVNTPFAVTDSAMALSPDGTALLYTQVDQSGSDIMMADFGTGWK